MGLKYFVRLSGSFFNDHGPLLINLVFKFSMSLRRSMSPATFGGGPHHRFATPSPQASKSPGNFYRSPAVGTSNMSLINESYSEWVEPILPEVCFEHVWTEPAPAIR